MRADGSVRLAAPALDLAALRLMRLLEHLLAEQARWPRALAMAARRSCEGHSGLSWGGTKAGTTWSQSLG